MLPITSHLPRPVFETFESSAEDVIVAVGVDAQKYVATPEYSQRIEAIAQDYLHDIHPRVFSAALRGPFGDQKAWGTHEEENRTVRSRHDEFVEESAAARARRREERVVVKASSIERQSSALSHVQDKDRTAVMRQTSERPSSSGSIRSSIGRERRLEATALWFQRSPRHSKSVAGGSPPATVRVHIPRPALGPRRQLENVGETHHPPHSSLSPMPPCRSEQNQETVLAPEASLPTPIDTETDQENRGVRHAFSTVNIRRRKSQEIVAPVRLPLDATERSCLECGVKHTCRWKAGPEKDEWLCNRCHQSSKRQGKIAEHAATTKRIHLADGHRDVSLLWATGVSVSDHQSHTTAEASNVERACAVETLATPQPLHGATASHGEDEFAQLSDLSGSKAASLIDCASGEQRPTSARHSPSSDRAESAHGRGCDSVTFVANPDTASEQPTAASIMLQEAVAARSARTGDAQSSRKFHIRLRKHTRMIWPNGITMAEWCIDSEAVALRGGTCAQLEKFIEPQEIAKQAVRARRERLHILSTKPKSRNLHSDKHPTRTAKRQQKGKARRSRKLVSFDTPEVPKARPQRRSQRVSTRMTRQSAPAGTWASTQSILFGDVDGADDSQTEFGSRQLNDEPSQSDFLTPFSRLRDEEETDASLAQKESSTQSLFGGVPHWSGNQCDWGTDKEGILNRDRSIARPSRPEALRTTMSEKDVDRLVQEANAMLGGWDIDDDLQASRKPEKGARQGHSDVTSTN